MTEDKDLNQQKYNSPLEQFNFPRPGTEEDLPLPSLEDVRDSKKKEFFSVPGENRPDSSLRP